MKGDFSRSTFRAKNHYSQVRAQQGRGVLDAELNEQADIAGHIARRSTTDIIGVSGAPFHPATAFRNFRVKAAPDGKDLQVAPGRSTSTASCVKTRLSRPRSCPSRTFPGGAAHGRRFVCRVPRRLGAACDPGRAARRRVSLVARTRAQWP